MQASDKFRVDIQGLRGIAVLLVVLYHLKLNMLSGGYIGVDIFFVISGYLITGHLIDSINSNHFNFLDFYAKRIRRIIPASLFVLFCTTVLSCILLPPLILPQTLKESIATAIYVPNLYYAFQQTDYLAETSISPFLHYWSLGVEEQFYLLWPIVLLVFWKSLKFNKNKLSIAILIVLLASFLGNYFLTKHSQPWAFFLLFTRAWELISGGLLAILFLGIPPRKNVSSQTLSLVFGLCGLCILGYCATTFDEFTTFPGAAAALPVIGTTLIILAGNLNNSTILNTLLANRLLQYFGTISYSLYLWHWPVIIFSEELFPNLDTIYSLIILLTVSIFLAHVTYCFIEQPFRYRYHNTSTKQVLFYSLSASVLLIATAGVYGYQIRTYQLYSDKISQKYTPTTDPIFTDFVPKNLIPELRQAKNSIPTVYSNDCHDDYFTSSAPGCIYGKTDGDKTYVLFGDSHAAQWFPALERYTKEHNIRLVSFTKSSCPSLDLRILQNKGTEYLNCRQWYKKVIGKINKINPDVIIISNSQANLNNVIAIDKKQEWRDGLERSIKHFRTDTNVIILSDTPSFARTPALCLSKNISSADECSFTREKSLNKELADVEKEVARNNNKKYVDMNKYLCSETHCGPIIGNVLVYRDSNHLTTVVSEHLSNMLGNAIEKHAVK